jgi:hypothetical protein
MVEGLKNALSLAAGTICYILSFSSKTECSCCFFQKITQIENHLAETPFRLSLHYFLLQYTIDLLHYGIYKFYDIHFQIINEKEIFHDSCKNRKRN